MNAAYRVQYAAVIVHIHWPRLNEFCQH